jgi:hypothetical protein
MIFTPAQRRSIKEWVAYLCFAVPFSLLAGAVFYFLLVGLGVN